MKCDLTITMRRGVWLGEEDQVKHKGVIVRDAESGGVYAANPDTMAQVATLGSVQPALWFARTIMLRGIERSWVPAIGDNVQYAQEWCLENLRPEGGE